MNIKRNNLDKSLSPYLIQHANNPIHWQEWHTDILDLAKKTRKLIFVSSGYSTCHWCHVMAKMTFSKDKVADFLNNEFISIKIDREKLPDIDNYLMSFMTEHYGHGGWPLNIIMTPDMKPFYAFTYAKAEDFITVLEHIIDFYNNNKENIMHYKPYQFKDKFADGNLINIIKANFDHVNKGFMGNQKFPSHSTILFLLFYYNKTKSEEAQNMVLETLDRMALSGLHDHLGGGFFRYCTDQEWLIPHFEKMMYDQAMHIMNYSLGYIILKKERYRDILLKILKYTDTQKNPEGLYWTALDADTEGIEGDTYLWDKEAVKEKNINKYFRTIPYEGKFHLVKRSFENIRNIEEDLLNLRDKKNQPFRDEKILTSNNLLMAIALYYAGLALNDLNYHKMTNNIYDHYKRIWLKYDKLHNIELNGEYEFRELLENYALFLVLATYIEKDQSIIKNIRERVMEYKKGDKWFMSINTELGDIPAQSFDHPIPSPFSLANMGLARASVLLNEEIENTKYMRPFYSDFYNLSIFFLENLIRVYSKEWIEILPFNTIQILSNNYQICDNNRCKLYASATELIQALENHGDVSLESHGDVSLVTSQTP